MVKYHEISHADYDPSHKPIDHIYYSTAHFEAGVYRNIYHPRNGYSASDHVPRYAEFTIKTADKA